MLAIGIAVMGVFIWLQQRNIRKVLLTLLPSVASVLFIFAIWALMGEEVSFLHVIGLLLSVSLCVDYGIFFMDNRGRGYRCHLSRHRRIHPDHLGILRRLGFGQDADFADFGVVRQSGRHYGISVVSVVDPKAEPDNDDASPHIPRRRHGLSVRQRRRRRCGRLY